MFQALRRLILRFRPIEPTIVVQPRFTPDWHNEERKG